MQKCELHDEAMQWYRKHGSSNLSKGYLRCCVDAVRAHLCIAVSVTYLRLDRLMLWRLMTLYKQLMRTFTKQSMEVNEKLTTNGKGEKNRYAYSMDNGREITGIFFLRFQRRVFVRFRWIHGPYHLKAHLGLSSYLLQHSIERAPCTLHWLMSTRVCSS